MQTKGIRIQGKNVNRGYRVLFGWFWKSLISREKTCLAFYCTMKDGKKKRIAFLVDDNPLDAYFAIFSLFFIGEVYLCYLDRSDSDGWPDFKKEQS
jgi:hypothetical protein